MKNKNFEKAKTICIIIGDASNDFTLELMRGINDAAKQKGTQLFYMTGKQRYIAPVDLNGDLDTLSHYNSIYDYINLVGADAYIISSGSLSGIESEEEYKLFLDRFDDFPYVLLHKEIDSSRSRCCSITIDNYFIFSQCIEHLIQHHEYKKIAYVSGPKQHPEAMERERAYCDTMKKFGLTVDESMVVYGDFSGSVDKQVTQLLLDHPDLEAIAFCNDGMAKTGYKVCESRGLRVGIDIAITGFDNFTRGQIMTPPLTTISQNAYRTGELALIQALELAEGRSAESVKIKTDLIIRNSCGCYYFDNTRINDAVAVFPDNNIKTIIEIIQEDLAHQFTRSDQKHLASAVEKLMDHVKLLALADPTEPLDERTLDAWLLNWVSQQNTAYGLITKQLNRSLIRIMDDNMQPGLKKLYRIIYHIQRFLLLYKIREASIQIENLRDQAWFIPEFIRDLVVLVDDDESVFSNVVSKLRSIGLRSFYICLLPEPKICCETQQLQDAERLLLAAYSSDRSAMAYPRFRMPVIDKDNTFRNLQDMKSTANIMSCDIFAGDTQFGIFLCEANGDNAPLPQIIGVQLGILINFLDLKRKEKLVTREIEHIQKKNETLNYLSEYDTLCDVYNRRGFIKQAMHLNLENIGKHAYLAFADLDRLKDINDKFGHSAGDDAIRTASEILKKVMRGGDLIARIGGDEFISMFIADNSSFQRKFESRVKQAIDEYNNASNKPYFVAVSIGVTKFKCIQDLDIGAIINKADKILYLAKKHRRANIFK